MQSCKHVAARNTVQTKASENSAIKRRKNNVFGSPLMGFHHIANWRVGGESAHDATSFSYTSLFGTINIQVLKLLR